MSLRTVCMMLKAPLCSPQSSGQLPTEQTVSQQHGFGPLLCVPVYVCVKECVCSTSQQCKSNSQCFPSNVYHRHLTFSFNPNHTLSFVQRHTHLLCHHGEWWHPVWRQWGWSGHGASCGGWTGLEPLCHLADVEGSFPFHSMPLFGHSASSWPAAGAGQWGETPADTGLSPCSGERHYIAGNNLARKIQQEDDNNV